MRKKVAVLFVFVMICTNTWSQALTISGEDAPVIRELSTFLESHQNLRRASSNVYSDADNLKKLVHDVQESDYFYSGSLRSYGEKPKNLFTDLASLSQLNNSNVRKNNIEIITIAINNQSELNSVVDLSLLSGFKNLKYIYFVSKVSITAQTIQGMLSNYTDKYSIYYKVINGDSE